MTKAIARAIASKVDVELDGRWRWVLMAATVAAAIGAALCWHFHHRTAAGAILVVAALLLGHHASELTLGRASSRLLAVLLAAGAYVYVGRQEDWHLSSPWVQWTVGVVFLVWAALYAVCVYATWQDEARAMILSSVELILAIGFLLAAHYMFSL